MRTPNAWACSVLIFCTALTAPAAAQSSSGMLAGRARAADGDSLVLNGKRIRLFGIDAPELSQSCKRGGEAWACGQVAKQKLEALVSSSDVVCKSLSIDAFGRDVATCAVGSTDINDAMVRSGFATAFRHYSTMYVGAEEAAHQARLGVWAGEFEIPADYRHDRARPIAERASTGPAIIRAIGPSASPGCRIKGNHSRRGEWIYHMPGMPYYAQTRAEAMFCTEAEAKAAGYRRSRADMHR